MLNTTKLGLIRFPVYNSVFRMNRKKNQFLYEGDVLAVIPGAYEIIEIAELIKKGTNGKVK